MSSPAVSAGCAVLLRMLIAGAALAVIAGCGEPAPTGQVVAQVGDDEITRRELSTELESSGAGPAAAGSAAETSALRAIVDRKLVVAHARALDLDRDPDFLAASLRSTELLLSAQLIRRWRTEVPPPSDQEIARTIADNPYRFNSRAFLEIAQFVVHCPVAPDLVGDARTQQQIAERLRERGITFSVTRDVIDTARVDAGFAARLSASAEATPLIQNSDAGCGVTVVNDARPAPPDEPTAKALAARLLAEAALQRRIDALWAATPPRDLRKKR